MGYLADRLSVNVELPSEQSLHLLAPDKGRHSIFRPMKQISVAGEESRQELTLYRHAPKFAPAGQSTQMIVGASPETDYHILQLSEGMYQKYGLKRVFYSAYIPVSDDPRLPDSFALAEEAGMKFTIHPVELRAAHPNTAVLTLKSKAGRILVLKAASVGGGRIRVTEIDGVPADFGGDSNTLIIHNEDTPGCIAEVTMSLAQRRINIASMQVFRAATGGYAVMVLECDSHIPHVLEQQMAVMPGIRKVTCLNIDEPEECEEG